METWRKALIVGGSIGYLAVSAYEFYLDRKAAKANSEAAKAYSQALDDAKHLCDLEMEAEELRHKLAMEAIEQAGIDEEKKRLEEQEEFARRMNDITEELRQHLSHINWIYTGT